MTYGPGITGQAFEFHDTPGERVVVPGGTAYLDQAGGLTLSAWINLNSLPGATPYVIASQAYSSTSETYGLYVNSGWTARLRVVCRRIVSQRDIHGSGPRIATRRVPASCGDDRRLDRHVLREDSEAVGSSGDARPAR